MIYGRNGGDGDGGGWGKQDDLRARGCRFYNDKYEINMVTLICPKHNCDVVHRVSIKRGIKTMAVARREGREAVAFWTPALFRRRGRKKEQPAQFGHWIGSLWLLGNNVTPRDVF